MSLLLYAWIPLCPAGVGGSLVDRDLQELRQVRDGCIGRGSQEEQLRLRLQELRLPLNGRRSDDISLRKLCEGMDINLQHPSGDRKGRDELVEAVVSALLSEVPVLGNLHMSFVDACLKDLREVRDSVSGQAPQRDELETNAFAGCGSLAGIALPESLTIIEPCAFADCTSLESVTIPESVTSIGENAFAECNSLKNITIVGSLTSISSYTFEGCECLTSIAIPNSVRVIEEFAFFRSFSLESVAMPYSVEEIGDSAFADCASLININIPESATIIGMRAFANCECLSEIKIPWSVRSLGDFAF